MAVAVVAGKLRILLHAVREGSIKGAGGEIRSGARGNERVRIWRGFAPQSPDENAVGDVQA